MDEAEKAKKKVYYQRWREKNKERILQRSKEYYDNNKEYYRNYYKEYKKTHGQKNYAKLYKARIDMAINVLENNETDTIQKSLSILKGDYDD